MIQGSVHSTGAGSSSPFRDLPELFVVHRLVVVVAAILQYSDKLTVLAAVAVAASVLVVVESIGSEHFHLEQKLLEYLSSEPQLLSSQ